MAESDVLTNGVNPPDKKRRHGCLTTWLLLIIVGGVLGFILYWPGGKAARRDPSWANPLRDALHVANAIFAIALWRWKKWGFYGFVATALAGLVINLSVYLPAHRYRSALVGVVGAVAAISILYWVLQMGNEKKAWTQLE